MNRCPWADGSPAAAHYHDTEWGVPSRDERHLGCPPPPPESDAMSRKLKRRGFKFVRCALDSDEGARAQSSR